MKVTISEVAKCAGVAKSTVSNVINNKDCVSEETKQKVLQVCKELNFSQNFIATQLATMKTGVIGLFLQIEGRGYHSFFNDVIESVIVHCEKYNYRTMIFLSVSNDELSKLLKFGKAPIDAAIILNPMVNDYRIEEMQHDLIPYVLIGSSNNQSNTSNCVDVDNFKVVYDLTDKMLKNSDTKKILLLNSPSNMTISRDRESGFIRAYVNNRIDITNAMHYNKLNDDMDLERIKTILINNPDIRGIITESDQQAKDVYGILAELNRKVGKDISVVALGGNDVCDSLNPKLSHVLIDYKTIGYRACRKLIEILNGETPDYTVEYVDTELVLTDSYIGFESDCFEGA